MNEAVTVYPFSQQCTAIQVHTDDDIRAIVPDAWIRRRTRDDGEVWQFNLLTKTSRDSITTLIEPGQWLVASPSGGLLVFSDEDSLLTRYRKVVQ